MFIEKSSFNSVRGLYTDIVKQLTGNGNPINNEITTSFFEFLTPQYANFVAFEADAAGLFVTLKPTISVDPMVLVTDVWTWALTLFIDNDQLKASWGVMRFDGSAGGEIDIVSGFLGAVNGDPSQMNDVNGGAIAELTAERNDKLVDEGQPSGGLQDGTFPPDNSNLHGFGLKGTDHGFGLVVFHQTKVRNWKQCAALIIQRPVKNDGTTLVKVAATDKAPLFAVWNNLDYGEGFDDPLWYKSVVQEVDKSYSTSTRISKHVNRPTGGFFDLNDRYRSSELYSLIDQEGPNTLYRLPTRWELPLTQDNKEVPLVFPFGLTTSRNVYMENMDILSVGPASVFTFGQDIEINVFGTPGEQREYRIYSSSTDCKGVVIALLTTVL